MDTWLMFLSQCQDHLICVISMTPRHEVKIERVKCYLIAAAWFSDGSSLTLCIQSIQFHFYLFKLFVIFVYPIFLVFFTSSYLSIFVLLQESEYGIKGVLGC